MNGATAPFNQSISFPVELKLATLADGIHVTRLPIWEIATLYGASQHLGATSVTATTNVFAGMQSKVFNLEIVLDVTKTAAKLVTFQLAEPQFYIQHPRGLCPVTMLRR